MGNLENRVDNLGGTGGKITDEVSYSKLAVRKMRKSRLRWFIPMQ